MTTKLSKTILMYGGDRLATMASSASYARHNLGAALRRMPLDPNIAALADKIRVLEAIKVRSYADASELLSQAELPGSACIVIDYNLPGLTGLEILRTLRSRGS